jgi:hypothetical protein
MLLEEDLKKFRRILTPFICFGVEIECLIDPYIAKRTFRLKPHAPVVRDTIIKKIKSDICTSQTPGARSYASQYIDRYWNNERYLRAKMYDKISTPFSRITGIVIGDDSSILTTFSDEISFEFKTPIIHSIVHKNKYDVTDFCTFLHYLNEKEFKVNSRCGTHIHLDAQKILPEVLYKIAEFFQINNKLIHENFIHPDRCNSTYCNKRSERELKNIKRILVSKKVSAGKMIVYLDGDESKYFDINFTNLYVYRTIEFRLLHGTLNPEEILNWVAFLFKTIDFCKNSRTIRKFSSFNSLKEALNCHSIKRFSDFNY